MSDSTIVIPRWGQGRPGLGQGGYTSSRFQAAIGQPVAISLRAPIPLESEMQIVEVEGGWQLQHNDALVMEATPSTIEFVDTESVTISSATDARSRFPVTAEEHNASSCLSCGFTERTMRVWPGLLADGTGRVATDWTPPEWAGNDAGIVHEHLVWMALDCTCGFYVGHHPERRNALTVRYAVEMLQPIEVGRTYVIVGHDGSWPGGWEGRKRGAASCVFDDAGNVVAHADSFWVSIPDAG
jgi:hypothetical protein